MKVKSIVQKSIFAKMMLYILTAVFVVFLASGIFRAKDQRYCD